MLACALWWMYFARFDPSVFDWALDGGLRARRRSFVYGYGHLVVYAALTAVGVGVNLGIEHAFNPADGRQAHVVLGLAVAAYLAGLSSVQGASPRGLGRAALTGRTLFMAGALALAAWGGDLPAPALVGLVAAAMVLQLGIEWHAERRATG